MAAALLPSPSPLCPHLSSPFSFFDPPQTAGKTRRTALIKEWRNVMSEVGDHQSMVASLKQSPMFNLFKDEVRTRMHLCEDWNDAQP